MNVLYDLQQAKEFVKNNIVIWGDPHSHELQKFCDDMLGYIPCMDGRGITHRVKDDELSLDEKIHKVWFSVPWGAVWLIVILYGVLNKLFDKSGFSVDKRKIDSMMPILISKYGSKLKYHTDHHHPEECIGCGFLKNAFKKSISSGEINIFWLDNDNIDAIYDLMDTYHYDGAILQWDHLEKAVMFLVSSPDNPKLFGMWHTDEISKDQCFILDIAMTMYATKNMLSDLAKLIQILNLHQSIDYDSESSRLLYKEHGITYSREEYLKDPHKYINTLLTQWFEDQLNSNILEIYKILAPNHPIYRVYLDIDNNPVVVAA